MNLGDNLDDPVPEQEPPPESVKRWYERIRELAAEQSAAERAEGLSDRYLKPDGSKR